MKNLRLNRLRRNKLMRLPKLLSNKKRKRMNWLKSNRKLLKKRLKLKKPTQLI